MIKLYLEEWRKKQGFTRHELSEKSGVKERTIRNLEAQNFPNTKLATLQSLAESLYLDNFNTLFVNPAKINSRLFKDFSIQKLVDHLILLENDIDSVKEDNKELISENNFLKQRMRDLKKLLNLVSD